ncbi:MAG: cadherin-like beta sandwich domain-containing protein [Clostridia bacterium]|nr:cadherin-like beta sandwich domain-containing protein [Clostridia bacterium]
MNLKNNFKITKSLLTSIILLICLVSGASCKVFETTCNPDSVKESNGGEPVYISVMHAENGKLPENFEIKIEFDNDVFKKSAKINYSNEISKNYKHNKSIFGSEISVKCSLKASKAAPEVPENQELFLITMETKKSIPKFETNFKITAEGDFENEIQSIPIKIEKPATNTKSNSEQSSAILTKLIPSRGTLSPGFNPNINEYSINVPHDTKDIEFDVDAENSSGININRHKLKAPGSETDVFITVKGEKRGDKNTYHVAVNRDDKPEGETVKPGGRSKKSDAYSTLKEIMPRKKSSRNSKQKSKKDKKYDTDEDYSRENDENASNSSVFKEMAITQSENPDKSKGKLYSIVILSSVLCLYAAYMVIKRKKHQKNKKELNKISKK